LSYDASKPLVIGTIRYNPVNDTLIVSANTGNKHNAHPPSKAWEFQLPDWPGIGGGVQLIHEYTLLGNYKNRTNIAINPNDGMMYATGYNYGSGTSGRSCISSTPTDPSDPNFGVNTLVLDGPAYYAATGDSNFYQMSAIVQVDCERAAGVFVPELITGMEVTANQRQVYSWDWNGPWVGGLGPFGQVGRIGTAGGAVGIRKRAVRAQRDAMTNEAFMVGAVDGDAANGGILQFGAGPPRYAGSFVIDGTVGYGDAASPMIPEPATLLLLALGTLPMLRRRRQS
jgi:hypothetical protein